MFTTLIIIWIICGIVHYGANLAYFQRAFPLISKNHKYEDKLVSLLLSFSGPISLFVYLLRSFIFVEKPFKYGFMWK